MKKALIGILIVSMLVLLVGCGGAKGQNITGITTTDNMVYFEPKCPKCNHIGLTKSANICEGEEYNSTCVCNKCNEIFDISIKR